MRLPSRHPNSRKGQIGKVLIVGGSKKYYGAPILTALGAQAAGADLITMYLPKEHHEAAKSHGLNFFLHDYVKDDLGLKDIGLITEAAAKHDVMIIGNGIGDDKDTQRAIIKILEKVKIPVVIDAEALLPDLFKIKKKSDWILTPHDREFKRLFKKPATKAQVRAVCQQFEICVLAKAREDLVASTREFFVNPTGNPEMRVGGTGDVLAGIVGSFWAQKLTQFEAASSAVYFLGKAGQDLVKKKSAFTAHELASFFPEFVKKYK